MSALVHFLNGKFVTEEKLLISPRDLGFARGYAVADFLVTHNHKPFKLSEHIDRLFHSAEIIGLYLPWTKEQIQNWVRETLGKNDRDTEKTIKIILSGGISHGLYQAETPTIVMIVSHYMRPPEIYYEKGVVAIAVQYKRQYSKAKHTHYVEAIKQLAKDSAIEEVIYYDGMQVFEGSGSNLFAVINNVVVTPKSNIVEGITRNVLLEIPNFPIPIEVRNFTFDELLTATEVFLTGSSKEIRGVVKINDQPVGDGKVGPITKEAARLYREYILKQ